mgnify:CR=1 FL=1
MTTDHLIWIFIGIASLIVGAFVFRSEAHTSRTVHKGVVSYVIDGDTLRIQGIERRIRLFGLDAPEKGEEGFRQATNALKDLTLDRPITCEEITIDRYNRIVGRCFNGKGQDITELMIKTGSAKEFCRYSKGHYGNC